MDNIFIAWSGNQSLANELANVIAGDKKYKATVGGGKPTDRYIGEQVINQINKCDAAILLVEHKNGAISPNLMFEWGYLVAKYSVNKIYTVLINISRNELPSDVLGTWVLEEKLDRESTTERCFAEDIYKKFIDDYERDVEFDYFDIIDDWKNYFYRIRNMERATEAELCRYIVIGCLAAYYYGDNEELKRSLNNIPCSDKLQDVVAFGKTYIDVFLNSQNMSRPLNDEQIYNVKDSFETLLKRERRLDNELDDIFDILCYDAYGLACALYLRNEDLDEEIKEYFGVLTQTNLEKVLEDIEKFESNYNDNRNVSILLKAYIHNDLSRYYKKTGDHEKHMSHLNKSVEKRKELYHIVKSTYPNNTFLIDKMEQEYMIALSAQCCYMSDPVLKKISINKIRKRLDDWLSDRNSLNSLISRIEANLLEV